jgi:lysophospholipase L1-like esterase
MRNVVFWGLLPLLAPQALYVRRTAPRFAPAAGPPHGIVGEGPEKRLLAIGDSIIAGVGAPTLDDALVGQTATALASRLNGRVRWQAFGVPGFNSRKVLDSLLPRLPGEAADFIIVSVGVNDITGVKTISTWRANLRQLLSRLLAHSPGAMIGIAGMPPMHGFPLLPQPLRAVAGLRAHSFDQVGQAVARSFDRVVHVPVDFDPDPAMFAADGYHPSAESYRLFGEAMAVRLVSGTSGSESAFPA